MLRHNIKTAWRHIVNNKKTTFIHLFGLSLALTAFLFISLWTANELSFDSYHKDARQIFMVKMQRAADQEPGSITVLPLAPTIKKDARVMSTARLTYDKPILQVGHQVYNVHAAAYVDSSWFTIFQNQVIAGSLSAFKRDPASIILTASKAKQIFGQENSVGQVVSIDSVAYKVQAVIADNPINSSFQYEVLRPMAARLNTPGRLARDNNWENASYRTFIKVLPGTDMEKFSGAVDNLARRRAATR